MKISEILKNNELTISCELFPPKEWSKLEEAKKIVADTAKLKPSFISVTYGAGGGTMKTTVDIANEIQNVNNTTALAHLNCIASTKETVRGVVEQFKERNIENILALRGDIPADPDFVSPNEYRYASELIEELKTLGDFCIGGACYPEKHPDSPTMKQDIEYLKMKVDSGLDFITTQMFLDNNIFYAYRYDLLKAGIDVPVIAGIMPVTNRNSIKRIVELSGTNVPLRFIKIMERFGDDAEAMRQAGIAYATDQIIDLIANGVNNIHIYTMNKPENAAAIYDNLSHIFKR